MPASSTRTCRRSCWLPATCWPSIPFSSWKETPTGFEYASKLPRRGGLDKVKLKAGKKAGKTAILVRRSGPNVTLPSLPLRASTSVTVQLRSSLGTCWGARYSAANRNDATHFKATSD